MTTSVPFQGSYDSEEADAIADEAAASNPVGIVCDECGKLYASPRSLAIHKGKTHTEHAEKRPRKMKPKMNGRPAVVDAARELIAITEELDELHAQVADAERRLDKARTRLAKAAAR